MKFGDKLKKYRKEQHLTQQEVADAIGVDRRTYLDYENNNAKPRNKEKYENLAKVLGCKLSDLKDDPSDPLMAIGAAGVALASALTVAGAVPAALLAGGTSIGAVSAMAILEKLSANDSKAGSAAKNKGAARKAMTEEDIKEAYTQLEQSKKTFQAKAIGTIMSALASKGIACQMGIPGENDDIGYAPDSSITILNSEVDKWWFIFFGADKDFSKYSRKFISTAANSMICRFTAFPADNKKITTIVTDSNELFLELCKYKGANSYRGNMSVLLIDSDSLSVVKEEYIATYDDENSDRLLRLM